MGITFTINGNQDYCHVNGLAVAHSEPCQCADFPEMVDGCHSCRGTRVFTCTNYPFEMSVTGSNAFDLLEIFGVINADYSGTISAQRILDGVAYVRALIASGCDPMLRGAERVRNYIDCGRSPEQVERYMEAMYTMAMEAARRKEEIVWG